MIPPAEQDALYERHPNNAIRLELAKTEGDYSNVAATFESWLREEVLEVETEPALYVYRQDFTVEGVKRRVVGVIGALGLEPFGKDAGVLPHERTMPGPKKDRLALLEACPVNFSPIYAIYRAGGGLTDFYETIATRPPIYRFLDGAGVLHRLWVVTAAGEKELLESSVAPGPLVIADGHHRYETALAYNERHSSEPGEHDSIMCFCVDADDAELVVLPYNRTLELPSESIERLAATFHTESIELQNARNGLEGSKADHAFVFVTADEALLVELSDTDVASTLGDRAAAWRALDVVVLHEVVFPAITTGELRALAFTRDPEEVIGAAREGRVGILMRAVAPTQVVDVAASGERMPQKASYFWPKAITGLVFRSLR